jgi:hypothetical protein
MKLCRTILRWLPCLLTAPLFAQPQIGGGTCNSATLTGIYSLTLAGRDLSSSVSFSNVLQGIGTANFDGLSKVTLTLTNNTNKVVGQAQTWSGTYSLQSNCIGAVTITTGDTANFTLGAYDNGEGYFITGQDGVYSFLGSGNTQPPASTTCTTSTLSGVYQANANGFLLTSGAISAVSQLSGLLTFDGAGNLTANFVLSVSGTSTPAAATGTYSVSTNCTATGTITDPLGDKFALVFTITTANGSNFIISAASPILMYSGSGRTL